MSLYDPNFSQKKVDPRSLKFNTFKCVSLLYEAGRQHQDGRCNVAVRDGKIRILVNYVSYKDGETVFTEKLQQIIEFKFPAEDALQISEGAFVIQVPGTRLKNLILVQEGFHVEYFEHIPWDTPEVF
jgi:hypothetical protein